MTKPGVKPQPVHERIARYTPDLPNDVCWPWQGTMRPDGYGVLHIRRPGYDRMELAHRLVVEHNLGRAVPRGVFVRHKCDNPPCVNPLHLEEGSPADNSRDMAERGRSTRGERHALARLTWAKVRSIRARLRAGESPASLAVEYGISAGHLRKIKSAERWKEET